MSNSRLAPRDRDGDLPTISLPTLRGVLRRVLRLA